MGRESEVAQDWGEVQTWMNPKMLVVEPAMDEMMEAVPEGSQVDDNDKH